MLRAQDVEKGDGEQGRDGNGEECEVSDGLGFTFEDEVVLYEFEFVLFSLPFDVDAHVLDVVQRLDVDDAVLILLGKDVGIESLLCLSLLFVDVVVKQLDALQMLFGLNLCSDVVGFVEQLSGLWNIFLQNVDIGQGDEGFKCVPMVRFLLHQGVCGLVLFDGFIVKFLLFVEPSIVGIAECYAEFAFRLNVFGHGETVVDPCGVYVLLVFEDGPDVGVVDGLSEWTVEFAFST